MVFSYGSKGYARAALICVASALSCNPDWEVTVYTTYPKLFSSLPVKVHPITREEIDAMRGPMGFGHRIKIRLLMKFAESVPDSEPICYLDADTYCVEPFNRFGGEAFMHHFDGNLGPEFVPELHQGISSNRELFKSGGYADFPADLAMYSGGLIYLPPGGQRRTVLRDVLELTDFLCLWFPLQLEWLEEAAFCYCLPKHYTLRAESCGTIHYLQTNLEVREALQSFSTEGLITLGQDRKHFDEILEGSAQFQNAPAHILGLKLAKMRRGLKKRLLNWRASRMQHLYKKPPLWG